MYKNYKDQRLNMWTPIQPASFVDMLSYYEQLFCLREKINEIIEKINNADLLAKGLKPGAKIGTSGNLKGLPVLFNGMEDITIDSYVRNTVHVSKRVGKHKIFETKKPIPETLSHLTFLFQELPLKLKKRCDEMGEGNPFETGVKEESYNKDELAWGVVRISFMHQELDATIDYLHNSLRPIDFAVELERNIKNVINNFSLVKRIDPCTLDKQSILELYYDVKQMNPRTECSLQEGREVTFTLISGLDNPHINYDTFITLKNDGLNDDTFDLPIGVEIVKPEIHFPLDTITLEGDTESPKVKIISRDILIPTETPQLIDSLEIKGKAKSSKQVIPRVRKPLSNDVVINIDELVIDEHDLPIASYTQKGIVQIKENTGLTIVNGLLSGNAGGGGEYELPTMSTSIKGGAKVGRGLVMEGEFLNVVDGGGGTGNLIDIALEGDAKTLVATPVSEHMVINNEVPQLIDSIQLIGKITSDVINIPNVLSPMKNDIKINVTSIDGSGVDLPIASKTNLGIMQVGDGLEVVNGLVSVDPNNVVYELPTMSKTIKGGAKLGSGLRMDGDVLSAIPSGGSRDFISDNYNPVTLYVNYLTGTNDADGTIDLPYKTVEKALNTHITNNLEIIVLACEEEGVQMLVDGTGYDKIKLKLTYDSLESESNPRIERLILKNCDLELTSTGLTAEYNSVEMFASNVVIKNRNGEAGEVRVNKLSIAQSNVVAKSFETSDFSVIKSIISCEDVSVGMFQGDLTSVFIFDSTISNKSSFYCTVDQLMVNRLLTETATFICDNIDVNKNYIYNTIFNDKTRDGIIKGCHNVYNSEFKCKMLTENVLFEFSKFTGAMEISNASLFKKCEFIRNDINAHGVANVFNAEESTIRLKDNFTGNVNLGFLLTDCDIFNFQDFTGMTANNCLKIVK